MNDARQTYIRITKQFNDYAKGYAPIPLVVVTYKHSFLYAKTGRVVNYQANMLIAAEFDLIQDIPHEYDDTQTFQNHQTITWWFLPVHLKIV
jgi:hypothetical protein